MPKHRGLILGGLVLALVALSPTSAAAKAGGTDRPMKGTFSGTVSLTVPALTLTSDATGVASHVGSYTTHLEGTAHFIPEGIVGSGTQTIVAANGDQATGTFTLFSEGLDPAEPHTTTLVITLTGGTGRFSDLTGTLTVNSVVSPISFVGGTLLNSAEGTVTGRVSY